MSELLDKIAAKLDGKPVKTLTKKELENLKKTLPTVRSAKSSGWGGARKGAGGAPRGMAMQKRIIKGIMYEHFIGSRDIQVTNNKTGKRTTIQKPNALIQIEKLFLIGQNDSDAHAIDLWFNRAIGKASQPIVGDEEDDPLRVDLGIDRLLNQSYGDEAQPNST